MARENLSAADAEEAMSYVLVGEATTALMIKPVVDRVLDPRAPDSRLALLTIPWTNYTVYLNSFFPASIRHVWTVLSISLFVVFLVKGLAEFFGNTVRE